MRSQQIRGKLDMPKMDNAGLITGIEPNPQFIIQVADEELGLLGYLVVDRLLGGRACGGVRMAADLTLPEIAHLARAMTLKFGFINVGSMGGAKAGIVTPKPLPPTKRSAILAAFGRHLAPLVRNGLYIPGEDLGVSNEDILILKQAAGLPTKSSTRERKKPAYFTSLTVFTAAEVLADSLRLKLADCSVAIEGFGKVGGSVAKLLSEAGTKIVGISTIDGGLYNPKGLDVQKLVMLREEVGDNVVKEYGRGKAIEKEELLTLKVDVLIPCGGAWTINSRNVNQLKAKMVVPGANIPVTADAEQTMLKMGILYLPDFVCNCGGILGGHLEWRGFEEEDIRRIFNQEFRRKILRIIELAQLKGCYPADVARNISEENFRKMESRERDGRRTGVMYALSRGRQKGLRKSLLQMAGDVYRLNIIPKGILRPLALAHVRNILRADDEIYS